MFEFLKKMFMNMGNHITGAASDVNHDIDFDMDNIDIDGLQIAAYATKC